MQWISTYNIAEIIFVPIVTTTMSEITIVQEKEGEFTGPRHALIHGIRLPFYKPNIDKDFEKDLSRFETRSDDVYVVSYPKSGKAD